MRVFLKSGMAARDLKTLLALASPLRSGGQLAGIAAETQEQRVQAQQELAEIALSRFLEEPVVPYDADEVTRLIVDSHDRAAFSAIKNFSVGEFRNWLLAYETDTEQLQKVAVGLTPEMVAAVSKI